VSWPSGQVLGLFSKGRVQARGRIKVDICVLKLPQDIYIELSYSVIVLCIAQIDSVL
jgi:hypothetical protein